MPNRNDLVQAQRDPWANIGRTRDNFPNRNKNYRSPSRVAAPSAMGIGGTGTPLLSLLSQNIGNFAQWAVPKLQQQGSQDPMQALLDQLTSLIGGGGQGGSFSEGDLAAQARAQAAAQFDPQIAAINSGISRGRRETDINKGGIDSLYDALAASYPADIRSSKANFKEATGREKQISGESKAATSAGYAESEQQLADVMRQLGIEEAAPGVLPEFAEDQAAALQRETERTTAEQSAYGRQAAAERSYYGQGPSLAHQAGTQGQQYLTEQLNQFLLDQHAQRSQLESQKALTYNALLGEGRQQAAQQAQEGQNNQFSQLSSLLNSILSVKRFDREGQQPQPGMEPSFSGTSGAANVLGQLAGTARGPDLNAELMNFLAEEVGTAAQAPDYPQALNLLRDYARDKGYSTMDLNALSQALAAIYSQYR